MNYWKSSIKIVLSLSSMILLGAGCETVSQRETDPTKSDPNVIKESVFAKKLECQKVGLAQSKEFEKSELQNYGSFLTRYCYSDQLNTCLGFQLTIAGAGESMLSSYSVSDLLTGTTLEDTDMKRSADLPVNAFEDQKVRFPCSK